MSEEMRKEALYNAIRSRQREESFTDVLNNAAKCYEFLIGISSGGDAGRVYSFDKDRVSRVVHDDAGVHVHLS